MKIKELLTDESKWTQKTWARDKDGNPCNELDAKACSWCLAGAVIRCYPSTNSGVRSWVWSIIEKETDIGSVSWWNDAPRRTFEEIKSLVERLDV